LRSQGGDGSAAEGEGEDEEKDENNNEEDEDTKDDREYFANNLFCGDIFEKAPLLEVQKMIDDWWKDTFNQYSKALQSSLRQQFAAWIAAQAKTCVDPKSTHVFVWTGVTFTSLFHTDLNEDNNPLLYVIVGTEMFWCSKAFLVRVPEMLEGDDIVCHVMTGKVMQELLSNALSRDVTLEERDDPDLQAGVLREWIFMCSEQQNSRVFRIFRLHIHQIGTGNSTRTIHKQVFLAEHLVDWTHIGRSNRLETNSTLALRILTTVVLTLSFSLSLSLTHTLSHKHTPTHTHTPTHPPTHTHTRTHKHTFAHRLRTHTPHETRTHVHRRRACQNGLKQFFRTNAEE
jgi:hypothetical protein